MIKKTFIFKSFDDLNITSNYPAFVDGDPSILSIGICLNSGCMYDCVYCYAKNSGNQLHGKLNVNDYLKLIMDAKDLGCKTVIITGVSSPSEPLLSPFIVPLIQKIGELGMNAVIYTNIYTLGNSELCEKVHKMSSKELSEFFYKNNVSFMISCDSIYEKDYNDIVQYDAFKCYLNAEKILCESGFLGQETEDKIITRVAISTVICKTNISYLGEMQKYFHKKNWQYICKFPSLMGNAVKYADNFFTPEEVKELRTQTSEKYTDKKETLVVETEKKDKFCLINQLGLAIDGEGKILSCLSGVPVLGEKNILNTSLKELILEKRRLYRILPGACPKKLKYYSYSD